MMNAFRIISGILYQKFLVNIVFVFFYFKLFYPCSIPRSLEVIRQVDRNSYKMFEKDLKNYFFSIASSDVKNGLVLFLKGIKE